MSHFVPPGATLGVLGGGQLGRMFTIAARRMGYRVHVLAPEQDAPTGQVADREFVAPYDDEETAAEFARSVAAVTFEFENVPAATVQLVERFAPVRPGGQVLHIAQHRLREKNFLVRCGVPVAPFAAVRDRFDLDIAVRQIGLPAVLKTADSEYDGKGQAMLASQEDVERAWPSFAGKEAVLEAKIDFACELSVIAARAGGGEMAFYGPVLNAHQRHILDTSVMPCACSPAVASEAEEIAAAICRELDLVGVLCVEFFLDRGERLLVNELAPRPHNSGHLTIDACETCQFEQQVRALCGWPLGSPRQHTPAAMANLLGDVWAFGEPDWLSAGPATKLHLYGKTHPQLGRKMGHITALAMTSEQALQVALKSRREISERFAGHQSRN